MPDAVGHRLGHGSGRVRPLPCFRRSATRDFDMHGRSFKAGDKVPSWFGSGNRDDAAFDTPMRVNPARSPNRHLAFGQGAPHVCQGMWLARLVARVLLEALAKRSRSIKPVGELCLRDQVAAGRGDSVITDKSATNDRTPRRNALRPADNHAGQVPAARQDVR